MSARGRVVVVVTLAALAAAGAAVVVAVIQREDAPAAVAPPSGDPPLVLDLGVRVDPEARALRRAVRLYNDGRAAQAAGVFARYDSLEAEIGAAVARWPDGTLAELRRLVREHPDSGGARLHLGFALLWSGLPGNAIEAWRAARRVEPDSGYAMRAEELLFPDFPEGRPRFVPSFRGPELRDVSPEQQLADLARAARRGGVREKLLYGVVLQRIDRPVSAQRQYDAALALAPDDPQAHTAAAVASFDKARPRAAFARLGPLTRRFPDSTTVRFHLGLLLLWLGDVPGARHQLELARRARDGDERLSAEATRFLRRLAKSEESREGG